MSYTATFFRFVILSVTQFISILLIFQFIYYLPHCFILLLTFNVPVVFSCLCFPYYFSVYHSVNFSILNLFLSGPFFPFALLKIDIFLRVFSIHSLIQFFLIPSDILFWQKRYCHSNKKDIQKNIKFCIYLILHTLFAMWPGLVDREVPRNYLLLNTFLLILCGILLIILTGMVSTWA